MSSGYGYASVQIVKLIMQETGTYNQQWRRSFESNLNGQIQNSILETCDRVGHITPGLLTGIANQFIKPSATPEKPISIVNGWDARRFRFFMEVHSKSHMGPVLIQYVTGYTDHMGATPNGALDPNMVFYINTVNTTKSSTRTTPLGTQNVQSMMDSSHLLYQPDYSGIYGNNTTHKMRPEDVFAGMQNADLHNASLDNGIDNSFIDTRSHLSSKPIKAARKYSSSPVYVAGILNSYVQTKRADISGISNMELFDTAAAHMACARVNQDPFIKKLMDSTGKGGMFTFGEISTIDPTIGNRIIVSPLTPALRATLHTAGQTQNWQSSDYDTQFATTLSQAVPGYMLDNCLQSVKFRATNDTGQGILVHITNYGTLLQGIDPAPFLASFTFAVQKTLLQDLSYNNQISFSVDMSCNLTGDTKIDLSLNGGPFVPYVTPCFCDALMSPLITADFNKFTSLTHDLGLVVDYLGDAKSIGTNVGFVNNQVESYI